MKLMVWSDFGVRLFGIALLFLLGMLMIGCSSAPEPQPEPSKKEVQQDSDRFFEKMKKEETSTP